MSYEGMPATVNIGHHVIEIRVEGKKNNKEFAKRKKVAGYSQRDFSNVVYIRKGLPLSQARTTLLHELMHQIGYMHSNMLTAPDFTDDEAWGPEHIWDAFEHHFIKMYQDSLIDLLRDNPKLRVFLLGV